MRITMHGAGIAGRGHSRARRPPTPAADPPLLCSGLVQTIVVGDTAWTVTAVTQLRKTMSGNGETAAPDGSRACDERLS